MAGGGPLRPRLDAGLDLDLGYVHGWTPTTDARLLVQTIGAVVRPSGAY
ncbi:hypothetical protein [Frigoribacterium sp. SL97]|nr:hypothetical protein [Frigoribacterium sp. SL97]WAC52134.1 hypothetical protein OVA02_02305 [Frigoribacterium sp. SL97]